MENPPAPLASQLRNARLLLAAALVVMLFLYSQLAASKQAVFQLCNATCTANDYTGWASSGTDCTCYGATPKPEIPYWAKNFAVTVAPP